MTGAPLVHKQKASTNMNFDKKLQGILCCLLLVASTAWAAVPAQMNYQGVLTDSGGTPVTDANYTVTFNIYNAPTGGSPLWTESESVATVGGVFTKVLGATNPLNSLAFDVPYWLGISIGGAPELPRQALLSSAYAMRAGSADNVGLPITGTVGLTATAAIDVTNTDNQGTAVRGTTSATSGTKAAVEGLSNSQASNAMGVHGKLTSSNAGSFSAGVYGENAGTGGLGIGVRGSHSGTGWGVYGTSDGRAIYGNAGGTTNASVGVYGRSASQSGSGVVAEAASDSAAALTITKGLLRVSGAGLGTNTTAFIHIADVATNMNASQTLTILDYPLLNGHPELILIVTPQIIKSGFPIVFTRWTYGTPNVFYNYSTGKWEIDIIDTTVTNPIVDQARFNVMVIRP